MPLFWSMSSSSKPVWSNFAVGMTLCWIGISLFWRTVTGLELESSLSSSSWYYSKSIYWSHPILKKSILCAIALTCYPCLFNKLYSFSYLISYLLCSYLPSFLTHLMHTFRGCLWDCGGCCYSVQFGDFSGWRSWVSGVEIAWVNWGLRRGWSVVFWAAV